MSNDFYVHGSVHHQIYIMNVQRDAALCGLYLFTARSLYMFRVPSTPIIRST